MHRGKSSAPTTRTSRFKTRDTARRITSPLSVHGRISGVDESIKIHVQQLHASGYLGEFCCVPGGGQDSPGDAVVNYAAPTDPVLIVSASTGGHVRNVERFTANAVRSG